MPDEVLLDVSDLPPPEPLERTLEAAEKLEYGLQKLDFMRTEPHFTLVRNQSAFGVYSRFRKRTHQYIEILR